jgi:hypothetical protein
MTTVRVEPWPCSNRTYGQKFCRIRRIHTIDNTVFSEMAARLSNSRGVATFAANDQALAQVKKEQDASSPG